MRRFVLWLDGHRAGRWIIRQINRLPEPRLSPYEELMAVEDFINPIYLAFLPLLMFLDYRANHHFGWSFWLLAVYVVFVAWMISQSKRWRSHWKPRIRGSISADHSSEFLNRVSDEITKEKAKLPEDAQIDFSRLINRCWSRYAEGLQWSNSVVNVTPYLDPNGVPQHRVDILFTLWFRTNVDAVQFKLQNADEFEYV